MLSLRSTAHSDFCGTGAPVKTGKVSKVQVLNSQGLANQAGPKSCVWTSNRPGEVLTGERAGRVLSRERQNLRLRSADVFSTIGRQHCGRRQRKTVAGSARSETPYMHGNILRGNRESLCLPTVE